jgi:hypothetical protein
MDAWPVNARHWAAPCSTRQMTAMGIECYFVVFFGEAAWMAKAAKLMVNRANTTHLIKVCAPSSMTVIQPKKQLQTH